MGHEDAAGNQLMPENSVESTTDAAGSNYRRSIQGDGLLAREWLDFCAVLDAPDLSWEARFERISERMSTIDFEALPEHLKCPVAGCYRRTIVGALHTDEEPGFEAVLAHWRLTCITPIHGHPPVVMYRVLSGRYRMTFYEKTDDGLSPVSERLLGPGDWLLHEGAGPGYEHFIHTVECLEEGWTLNLYSDDALKGVKYNV